jgi:hypothetical protein
VCNLSPSFSRPGGNLIASFVALSLLPLVLLLFPKVLLSFCLDVFFVDKFPHFTISTICMSHRFNILTRKNGGMQVSFGECR